MEATLHMYKQSSACALVTYFSHIVNELALALKVSNSCSAIARYSFTDIGPGAKPALRKPRKDAMLTTVIALMSTIKLRRSSPAFPVPASPANPRGVVVYWTSGIHLKSKTVGSPRPPISVL